MPPSPSLPDVFQAHRHGLAGAVRGVLGCGADLQEVLQEAFLRCWPRWQRGELPADPVAWIFVVTWNVAVDVRRRRRRRRTANGLDEELLMQPAIEAEPAAAAEQRDEVSRAQRAIERLADHEKQVFLLRVSGGLSFAAVATALSIPEGTAKTRMRAALQRLRWALGADLELADGLAKQERSKKRSER